MQLPNDRELAEFDKWKKERPSHEEHDAPDSWEHPLSERLVSGNARNWHLSGNVLHCDTDFGPMAQRIDPGYILTGVDDKGLPLLRKVLL